RAPRRRHQRDHRLCPRAHGRRLQLGRDQALPRRVGRADDAEGHPASGGRREGGGDRRRRHLGVEPRWAPNRGSGANHRRAAGHRRGGRLEGHHLARQRRALGTGRDARAGARRQRGVRRQVVFVGGRRARRRGAGPADRPVRAGTARLARPDRRAVDRGRPQRQDPAPWGDQVLRSRAPDAVRHEVTHRRSGATLMSAIAEPIPHLHDDRLARRNALVLAAAQALAGGNNTVIVSTSSIIGAVLAPDKGLATLPITFMVFGMWMGTLPVGALARRFGRRFALQTGSLFGILSGLISYTAVMQGSFGMLLAGTFCGGLYAAAHQSYRFAAADTASDRFRARAVSYVLAGGIFAAIIGPQLV